MKTIALLAALTMGSVATAQENLERAAAEFAKKLSPEGAGAKLAEAAKTEAGRRALEEALRDAVAWKVRPYERDPESHFEAYFFTRDDDGTLRPRPERARHLEALSKEVEKARATFAEFVKRAEAFAAKLPEATEAQKRAKAAWQDPRYRQAMFAEFARESDDDDEESVERALEKALRQDPSGKLHVREDSAKEVSERAVDAFSRLLRGDAKAIAYEEAVGRLTDPEAKRVLSSPFAKSFVAARVGRVDPDQGDPLNHVLTLYGLVDGEAVALGRLKKDVEAAEKCLAELKPRLDEIAGALADGVKQNQALKTFLSEEPSRAALVEDLLARTFEEGDPFDRFFAERGVPNEEGEEDDPADAVGDFAERRAPFTDMAERCADPALAAVLTEPLAVAILENHRDNVVESMVRAAYDGAAASFARRYCTGTGDLYQWREDRAAKAEEIVARAQRIAKEMAEDAAEDAQDEEK